MPRFSSSRRVPPPTAATRSARGQARTCGIALATAVGLTKIARSNSCRRASAARRRHVLDLDRREKDARGRPPASIRRARRCACARGRVTRIASALQRPNQRPRISVRALAAQVLAQRWLPSASGSARLALELAARSRACRRPRRPARATAAGCRAVCSFGKRGERQRAAAAERAAHGALGAHAGRGRRHRRAARAARPRPRARRGIRCRARPAPAPAASPRRRAAP